MNRILVTVALLVLALGTMTVATATSSLRVKDGYACPVGPAHNIHNNFGAPRRGHRHQGVDIGAPWGSPLYAAETGRIARVGWSRLGGKIIVLDGESQQYLYAHASKILVHAGQNVRPGQLIGRVGDTGNAVGAHAHFEIRRQVKPGKYVPINPYPWVRKHCS